jgi:hypothetical protein
MKKQWTAAERKAFAAKMKAARAAKRRGRKSNPGSRVHMKAFDRCVKQVKRSAKKYHRKANAYAVCEASLGEQRSITKRHRRRNTAKRITPYFILIAEKGGKRLYFDGHHFTQRRAAYHFHSQRAAINQGRVLLREYPVLKPYRLFVEMI